MERARRLRVSDAATGAPVGDAVDNAAALVALALISGDRLNGRRLRKVVVSFTPAGVRMLVVERSVRA